MELVAGWQWGKVGDRAVKLMGTSLDHRISFKEFLSALGLLMTLTFYEYPHLCEMISLIKSSIKVTDPLQRQARENPLLTLSNWKSFLYLYEKYVNRSFN